MKDTSKASLRRGHNEGNIRQRTDGRWEVRLSAGIDYKTGKPKRTSTCCNTRQEAIAILQQQAHEVRTQGWRDPMSVTLGEWYEYWLDTYMKDTVKQSTYASYRSYLNKHFCVLGKILLKKLEPHTLQEFYNYKFREEGLSPKTLRNYHMALHKCLQQAVKEHLLVYNPCDAVTLPGGEKPEIVVFTNDQQRALVQASYRHRYGVFIRLDLCTGLRMGELLALKWEDIDFSTAQLHVRRTINRLAKYDAHDGENKTEIVFGTPKTKNSRRTIPLTRTMADELTRWKQQQAQDKILAGDKYTDDGFIVTNEFGHYFEQKTFNGHYHPTEVVSDKIPALLAFFPEIALHITRPIRWDSDHVVRLDDETQEICKEIVRCGGLDGRVNIALDYFDASINRIAAWTVGFRSVQKALLQALLTPNAAFKAMQDEGRFTELLVAQEESKTLPFGEIWAEYCRRAGVPEDGQWLAQVQAYERDVLSKRV